MQTFLPYPDFAASASVLDRLRLGKQRVECVQVLSAIAGVTKGWRNHPCVAMWRPYPQLLAAYTYAVCDEWTSRGYKDTCRAKAQVVAARCPRDVGRPTWLGDPSFHASHRSNLLRKLPVHYSVYGWSEPPTLPYVWPRP